MKKTIKLLAITIIIAMLMPNVMVNAATTKTEDIVESLKENVKSFDGTVNYENDTIEIEWNTPNSKFTEMTYSYNGNVIEYDSGEITSYEEAEVAGGHYMYAIYLIKSALRVNGYSDEEIKECFNNEKYEFDYKRNGIEINFGESKSFTSSDGSSTLTTSPMSIKINLAKSNLENDNKIYVIENDGNTATFEFNKGHNYILNMIDLLTIDSANSETLFGVDSDTFIDAINIMKNNAKEYGDVISIFNILIQDGNLDYTNAVSLKIKLTEAMKKYNTLKLLYLDDENDFQVTDVKNLTINSETGDVDLDHLSVYALVRSNVEINTNTTNNPQTGDNIMFYISLLGISVIGLVGVGIYAKKKLFNK